MTSIGPPGLIGPVGLKGNIGPFGTPGIDGFSGRDGEKGDRGFQGKKKRRIIVTIECFFAYCCAKMRLLYKIDKFV